MGFVFSILYFVTEYLTPPTIFGPLAVFRVELILAILLLFVSLPKLAKSFILKTPQSLALIGQPFAGFLSVFAAARWALGAVKAFLEFLLEFFTYFFSDSSRAPEIETVNIVRSQNYCRKDC